MRKVQFEDDPPRIMYNNRFAQKSLIITTETSTIYEGNNVESNEFADAFRLWYFWGEIGHYQESNNLIMQHLTSIFTQMGFTTRHKAENLISLYNFLQHGESSQYSLHNQCIQILLCRNCFGVSWK